jgi:ABC-type multidrug transport system fused ATPase/permease subunit
MTVAMETQDTLEVNEGRKAEKAIDKKGTTGPTLKRLTAKMASGDSRNKFIVGTILRLLALAALVMLPYITGQAMNVLNEGGTTDELLRWAAYGVILGLVFLVLSFFADRTFAKLATKALYKLQTELFSNLQTLSMGFFYRTPVGELF